MTAPTAGKRLSEIQDSIRRHERQFKFYENWLPVRFPSRVPCRTGRRHYPAVRYSRQVHRNPARYSQHSHSRQLCRQLAQQGAESPQSSAQTQTVANRNGKQPARKQTDTNRHKIKNTAQRTQQCYTWKIAPSSSKTTALTSASATARRAGYSGQMTIPTGNHDGPRPPCRSEVFHNARNFTADEIKTRGQVAQCTCLLRIVHCAT